MNFFIILLSFFTLNQPVQNSNPPVLSWSFLSIEDDMSIPRTTIFLSVDGKKYEVGKGVGNFNEIEKKDFSLSQFQIPTKALSACTGFWAGLAQHFCVIQKGNVLEVKEGFLEAESPKRTKVKFKTVMKITLE